MKTNELVPFHDRRALDVLVQVAYDLQPRTIVILGDVQDLVEWTDKFLHTPEFYFTTQPALVECVWWLARLRKSCPQSRIIYLKGNHEKRLEKMIAKHLPAAYGLLKGTHIDGHPSLSIQSLLGLDSLDIEYIDDYPDGIFWLTDDVACIHGDVARAQSGRTSTAILEASTHSVIYGHIHRLELIYRSIAYHKDRKPIFAFTPGCMCHIDGRVPGADSRDNWQQGFGVVYSGDDFPVVPVPVPVVNGVARLGDLKYIADDAISSITPQF